MKNLEMNVLGNRRYGSGASFKKVLLFLAIITNVFLTVVGNCHSQTIEKKEGPLVTNIPTVNYLFVGRQKHLTKLQEKLMTHKVPGMIAIVGMAGMGKTQLAKQYGHAYAKSYNVIWWIDANQDLLSQIREFAQNLASFKAYPMPNINEKRQEKWLEAVKDCCDQHGFKVLLIIDDVKDKAVIKQMTQILQNFHILLTSRDQSIGDNSMLVNCFTRKESTNYLKSCLPGTTVSSLDELAGILNDYPLALAQAATYISLFPSLSITEYISLYKDKRKSLWTQEESVLNKSTETPLSEYQRTVAATFTLLLEQVNKASPHALTLLQFSSFLGSQDIPQALLKDWIVNHRKVDDFDFHRGLSTLIKLSIFEKKEDGEILFNIHEVLQEFIRESLTKEEKKQYLEELTNLISTYLPESSQQLWRLLFKDRHLEFHIGSLLRFADDYNFEGDEILKLKIKYLHFAYFFKSDIQTVSDKIADLEKQVRHHKTLPPLDKGRFLILLANFTALGSSYEEATSLSEEAEVILTNVQLQEAREELFFLLVNNLMDYYNLRGDLKKAEEAAKKAELLLPHINEANYIALYHFIRSAQLLNKGEYTEALRHIDLSIEKLPATDFPPYVPFFKKVFKAEILAKLGALKKASALAEVNYKGLKKIYPHESNYKILKTEIALAFIYLKQGKLEQSLHFIRLVMDGLKAFYKKPYESPIQGSPHIFLGELYEKQNDFLKALVEYKRAEEIYSHIYKTIEVDDISYLYRNLAILGEKVKDDFITLTYFQLLLRHFGRDHFRTQEVVDYLEAKGLQVPWSKL